MLVAPGGEKRRLVEEIGQLGAGETGRAAGDDAQVDVLAQAHLARMHAQDLLPADHVGQVDEDLAVEAARAQERAVQHVRPVGRRDDDHALGRVEAVHLDQERVEGLLALVVAAAQAGPALAADRVDLVDEDEAGGALAALLEHVAHARGADTDEHFDEVGAGDAEEGNVGLAGHRLGEERLARARGADHEDALRDPAPHLGELLRVLKEFDDLRNLLLGLVAARDVAERDLVTVARQELGPALSEIKRAPARLAQLAHEEEIEDPHDDQDRDHLGGDLGHQVGRGALGELVRLLQALHVQVGQAPRGAKRRRLHLPVVGQGRIVELAGDCHPVAASRRIGLDHGSRLDVARLGVRHHLIDGQLRGRHGDPRRPVNQGHHGHQQDHPEDKHLGLKAIGRYVLKLAAGFLCVVVGH